MSLLTVELGERSYPIHIQPGLLNQKELLKANLPSQKLVVVTNDTVKPLYGEQLEQALEGLDVHWIVLPDGEKFKTLESFERIMGELLQLGAARDTGIIALGGGVIGDLTGFAAACYQRGVPFIQIPTTLLSQVDSSVGGKTAVNHPLGKNMIGAFYQPKSVLIDTLSLKTLPETEFAAGMAEVIKYGIIYDAAFFEWLEQNQQALWEQQSDAIIHAVHTSCAIKAKIVAEDETEKGVRALLNLGHTFGHAIEAEQGYGQWLHGHAVAAGMNIAAKAAMRLGWLNESEVRRIQSLIQAFRLPLEAPADMDYDCFMRHMQHDKKVMGGKIRFVIPRSLGHAVVTELDDEVLRDIL